MKARARQTVTTALHQRPDRRTRAHRLTPFDGCRHRLVRRLRMAMLDDDDTDPGDTPRERDLPVGDGRDRITGLAGEVNTSMAGRIFGRGRIERSPDLVGCLL